MDNSSVEGSNNEEILMDFTSAESQQHSSDNHNQQSHCRDTDSEIVFDDESVISDCERGNSDASSSQFQGFCNGLVRLSEGDKYNDVIKERFLKGLGLLGKQVTRVAIYRNMFSQSLLSKAKLQSYQVLIKAMEKKCGGNANVKYAWFGARSRDEICNIMNHGFGPQINDNNGLHGCGIYLSPDHSPLESARNLRVDEDGWRHLLLCRVILGKPEVVHPGSDQSHPSSEEFDSGIDTFSNPSKYIVWSTYMNPHILPEFVISFKAPGCLKGFFKTQESPDVPTSPWMSFPALISALSKFLPAATVNRLNKFRKDHKENRISREELVRRVRQTAGDNLLIAVIKSNRTKNFSTKKLRSSQEGLSNEL